MSRTPSDRTLSLPRMLAVAVVALLAAAGLAGCGSSDSSGSPASATKSSLKITVKGDTVTPMNTSVKVAQGKPFTFTITADAPGEIHVHSSPEKHIEFKRGTTTEKVTFDKAGVIAVEDHATDSLIAKLQVS